MTANFDKYKNEFNLDLLRGWQRSQLKLLGEFTIHDLVPQSLMGNASGTNVGSAELGGKITALTRAGLIQKAGKDENGQWLWQLNEQKVEKTDLKKFLDSIGIDLNDSAA
jgi:hypothetical protein